MQSLNLQSEHSSPSNERLLQLVAQQAVKISDLEEWNKRLQEQLGAQVAVAGREELPGKNPESEHQLALFKAAYDDLAGQHARCDGNLRKAKEMYQGAVKVVHQWHDYFQKHQERKARDASEEQVVRSEAKEEPKMPEPTLDKPETDKQRTSQHSGDRARTGASAADCEIAQTTSSQTTAEEETVQPQQVESAEDDEPEIVSERSLKRRRLNTRSAVPFIKQEPGTDVEPVSISSDGDNSPIVQPSHLRSEITDLNTETTPVTSCRLLVAEHGEKNLLAKAAPLITDGMRGLQHPTSSAPDNIAQDKQQQSRQPLGQISANVMQMKSRSDRSFNTSSAPMLGKRHNHLAIAAHGEPGSKGPAIVQPSTPQQPVRVSLVELLEAPNAANVELPTSIISAKKRPRSIPPTGKENIRPMSFDTNLSNRHAASAPKEGGTSNKPQSRLIVDENRHSVNEVHATPERRSDVRRSRPLMPKPQTTPLRLLSLEALQPEDFRPNPNFQGPVTTFVAPLLHDTGRVCLPGCTRPNCCGSKYRRMVEIGGKEVSGKTDRQALEDYLGPEYADIIAVYGPEKREELILQAHAAAYAGMVPSKQRTKPGTPPGYWQIDMPNTQELQEQQRQAAEMERRTVVERRHEALRKNGQWLFRDEAAA